MSLSLKSYALIEALIGRSFAWRVGRWLYLGSRRELQNDPRVNGEYALQTWFAADCTKHPAGSPKLCVVDVGANVGNWSAHFVGRFQASGISGYVIHAFEPAPEQSEYLKKALSAQVDDGTVVPDSRAVGAAKGLAKFTVTGGHAGNNSLQTRAERPADAETIDVAIITLDDLCAERGYARIDFAKVDTEGNDFNVILGARALFDREAIGLLQFEYNWRWIEFGHWLKEVFGFLEGRPYLLGRLTKDGIELYRDWHPELDRYIETNYVILHHDMLTRIPNWRATFDRSNTARRFRVS